MVGNWSVPLMRDFGFLSHAPEGRNHIIMVTVFVIGIPIVLGLFWLIYNDTKKLYAY